MKGSLLLNRNSRKFNLFAEELLVNGGGGDLAHLSGVDSLGTAVDAIAPGKDTGDRCLHRIVDNESTGIIDLDHRLRIKRSEREAMVRAAITARRSITADRPVTTVHLSPRWLLDAMRPLRWMTRLGRP